MKCIYCNSTKDVVRRLDGGKYSSYSCESSMCGAYFDERDIEREEKRKKILLQIESRSIERLRYLYSDAKLNQEIYEKEINRLKRKSRLLEEKIEKIGLLIMGKNNEEEEK